MAATGIQPTGALILVKPIMVDAQTAGGIFLPDATRDKLTVEGEVIAVGPGRTLWNGDRTPVNVLVGDRVVLGTQEQLEVRVAADVYLLVEENAILGVVVDE